MKKQSVFVTALAWVLYQIGDKVSLIGHKVDLYVLWWIYQTVMRWSCALDKAGKVWDFPDNDEEPRNNARD